jgi:hypothetical protein
MDNDTRRTLYKTLFRIQMRAIDLAQKAGSGWKKQLVDDVFYRLQEVAEQLIFGTPDYRQVRLELFGALGSLNAVDTILRVS